nr:hypothetical protein [Tanacetum cinerariifolium]
MANLEFCDTHNMVAYLLKTERSNGFHQIVYFLNSSHIKYALTENPTIYASLIQQFWQTAAANTLDTKEVQITAIIDEKVKLVSEASIRRHLKLEDSNGITTLPKQVDFPKRHGKAATTVSSLDAGQGSGNINKTLSMPHDLPLLRVHTLISDKGRMQQNELIDLVTKLTDRVLALETDLQLIKKVYSTAVTKLIMKVKKLEKIVKSTKARRRAKIVVSDDEDAAKDTSKQGRKIDEIYQDPNISLVQHDAEVQGRHEQETKFETKDISTAETLVYIRRSASKNKDIQATIEADEELALRIQAKEREKYSEAKRARLIVELINQRKRHFAQQRDEERRNKPMTQAQQTCLIINMKRVFTPMESDFDRTIPKIADESSKRAAEENLNKKVLRDKSLEKAQNQEKKKMMN